jgi:hypothetical protein
MVKELLVVLLKPDVVEFLEESGIVLINGDVRSYVVNGHVYTETKNKGEYQISQLSNETW